MKNTETIKPLGYALCKRWRDNPDELAVHEYYATIGEANEAARTEKKDPRFTWVIGKYE
jgi:hypothetical protein